MSEPSGLTPPPSLQLCLAHYCDVHGPTPLMVTEGIPVDCSQCPDHELPAFLMASDRTRPRSGTNDPLRSLASGGRASSRSVSVPEHDALAGRASLARSTAGRHPNISSTIDTPPDSPRRAHDSRRDSGFRKTYNEFVTSRASPCDNCAMTLPERQDGPGTPTLKADMRGPTLRTRAPFAKVYGGQTPPASQSSAGSDTDGEDPASSRLHGSASTRTSSSSSSSTSAHTHYLNYTSTHEPLKPESFSIVRNSCLRTLSFEMLPRAPNAPGGVTSPQSPTIPSGQFVTTHTTGAAVSGGSIFFGDPLAGYTTAYIFRIPDVHARGHKRVYALMAISTYPESTTVKTFAYVSSIFQELAGWIQKLAEAEAETARLASPVCPPWFGWSGYQSQMGVGAQDVSADRRSSGSSFLSSGGGSGLARRMGGGGGGFAPKARGLAELVGLPDIFIQLHRRFVPILFELSVRLNS